MRLTRVLLGRRGWYRPLTEEPDSRHLRRLGELKWKDYQSPVVDPPYWYKWSKRSPYHPEEQQRILSAEDIGWYRNTFFRRKIVEPDDWLYKVGDKVEILEGKDKGKRGDVIKVVPEANFILVGGLNVKYQQGIGDRWFREEEPLEHDQISLIDPKDDKLTDVEFRVDEGGQRVRVSRRTGHIIQWPLEVLADGTKKVDYVCGDNDTSYDDATQRTYKPSMDFWEDEMKAIFNVVDPPRRKTFWY